MSKNIIIFLFILTNNQMTVADEWQKSDQGLKYKIEGVSNEDVEKSKGPIEIWQRQTSKLFSKLDELGVDYSNLNYQQMPFEKVVYGLIYSYSMVSVNKRGPCNRHIC